MTTENLIINISRKDFLTRKSNFFNRNSNKTFDGRYVLQWDLVQSREAKKRIHTEGVAY